MSPGTGEGDEALPSKLTWHWSRAFENSFQHVKTLLVGYQVVYVKDILHLYSTSYPYPTPSPTHHSLQPHFCSPSHPSPLLVCSPYPRMTRPKDGKWDQGQFEAMWCFYVLGKSSHLIFFRIHVKISIKNNRKQLCQKVMFHIAKLAGSFWSLICKSDASRSNASPSTGDDSAKNLANLAHSRQEPVWISEKSELNKV